MSGERSLYGMAALVFIAGAAVTIAWCGSMSAMPGMPMPGGWTMSMVWMRMPGQGWMEAGGAFIGMWTVMMMSMMLPVFTPQLVQGWRQRGRLGVASLAGFCGGYFGAWILFGLVVFCAGVRFNSLAMQSDALSKAIPVLGGLAVLVAGILQFTSWKARLLRRCHPADPCCHARTASMHPLRAGMRLGRDCIACCAGFTTLLLVSGVMDLVAMALVTIAISAERLSASARVARGIGVAMWVWGACLLVRAAG